MTLQEFTVKTECKSRVNVISTINEISRTNYSVAICKRRLTIMRVLLRRFFLNLLCASSVISFISFPLDGLDLMGRLNKKFPLDT